MFDCHIHTNFSSDSRMSIEEAIEASKQKDIGIIITDHMDMGLSPEGKFVFNPEEYFNEYEKYRTEKLLLGIEIGMRNECIGENRRIANNNPFDYVIGSLHVVNGLDPFYEEFYRGKNKKEAYEEYFKCMAGCLRTHDFIDSLGHIEYIARYARYEDKEAYYKDFSECIDEVLKIAAGRGISIEINTRRLQDKVAFENMVSICKRFHELGGETVTIGSDAHRAEDIGKSMKEAAKIASLSDLKVVYYKNRRKYYNK